MRHAAALALLPLLFLPRVAPAQSLRLLNTTVVEQRGDNKNGVDTDDDYGVGINKLYLDGQMEDTSLSLQVDSVVFSGFPDAAGLPPGQSSAYANDFRLKRITLAHQMGDASFTLGDSYMQLGRGLILSLRKVDELGAEQSMRGGVAGWQGEILSAKAFAGITNVANLDGPTQKFVENPNDTLAGASTTLHLGRADLSFHGLYLQQRTPTLEGIDGEHTLAGGAYLDLPMTDWLSLYVEGAMEQYRIITVDESGTAVYASADMDLQLVSLLVEGLWLEQFRVIGSTNPVLPTPITYNQPPTLERIDQEVSDNENVRGLRGKVSRSFLDGSLVLYTSGLLRQIDPKAVYTNVWHGYGGFELTYGGGRSRWYASAGYREEIKEDALIATKSMRHAETDWVQSVGGPYALHIVLAHESRTLDSRDYVRGSTMLGIEQAHLGSLTAEIGYDTQNENTQQLFFAGIIGLFPTDWLRLKAVVGSQRGGIKCVGGVCRDFPAFSGVQFEAAVQYDLL